MTQLYACLHSFALSHPALSQTVEYSILYYAVGPAVSLLSSWQLQVMETVGFKVTDSLQGPPGTLRILDGLSGEQSL